MLYYITGGTGFIGRHLVKELIRTGNQVRMLVRDRRKVPETFRDIVELIEGDITDKHSMGKSLKGCDGLFHLAAWYKLGAADKSDAYRINVDGTRNVLELMRESGISRGVYTSTLAVFSDTKNQEVTEDYLYRGKHLSEYDRTKWLAHYTVALPMIKRGLPLMIVQPGAVYGPGDTSTLGESIRLYLQGKLFLIPRKMKVCWAYIDDVVNSLIRVMERGMPGKSYITAGPAFSLEEVLDLAEKITGIKAPSIRVSPWFMKRLSQIMIILEKVFSLPAVYHSESLRVTAGVTYLGSSKLAENELGCHFRDLDDGLTITLTAMLKELRKPDIQ